MKIFKYPLNINHLAETVIKIKNGSKLLAIDLQGDNYNAWFEVNPEINEIIDFSIYCIYTGQQFNSVGLQYVKTVVEDETFVAHFYIKKEFADFLGKDDFKL